MKKCHLYRKFQYIGFLDYIFGVFLKRDGVCNPVTHVLKVIENRKRFGRGCKPRPAQGVVYWQKDR